MDDVVKVDHPTATAVCSCSSELVYPEQYRWWLVYLVAPLIVIRNLIFPFLLRCMSPSVC